MQELLPRGDGGSVYAMEGTAAHALAEIEASLAFGFYTKARYKGARNTWRKTYDIDEATELEMEVHAKSYVALLKERASLYDHTQLLLERRMDTGVPASWGTSDAVLVSPVHVEIVDYKFGAGVAVEAEDNPQLKLYALGALDTYGDVLGETELVRMTVHQPRMDHVLTAEMTPEALRAWRTEIIPIAELALTDDAPFGPSEVACRWCPASGRCAAQLEAVILEDFGTPPEVLTPEQMAEILPKLPEIAQWMKAFEAAALDIAYAQGGQIPGYKVVKSGGVRKHLDEDESIAYLTGPLGLKRSQVVNEKIRGLGELEKVMGKKEFAECMKNHLGKTEGKPALVPESDPRPPISPTQQAQEDFRDEAT
jgi:RecB family exonuclease